MGGIEMRCLQSMYSIYTERPHLSTKPKLGKCRAHPSSSSRTEDVFQVFTKLKCRIKSGRVGDSPYGVSSSGA
jgi:hypothetical protein